VEPKYGVFIWVACAIISSVFASLVKCKIILNLLFGIEDLKRLDQDDVRASEYIEEDVIRKYSFEQRSQLFRNSNVIMSHADDDPNIIFKFEGGTGGLDSHALGRSKSNLNRSHDIAESSGNIRDTGASDKKDTY